MIGLLTFIIALACLYLLSQAFLQNLYEVLLKITRSHKKAVYFLALLFLPGTFIHEISHFMTALFLLVPVGELKLIPEVSGKGVNLGSVQIGKTDVLRHAIIGIAPFIVGTVIILGLIWNGISNNQLYNPLYITFSLYIIFQLSHTMFSSKRDLKAVIELTVVLIIVILLLVLFNITEPFEVIAKSLETNREMVERFSLYMFIPIFIEAALFLFMRSINNNSLK